MSIQGAINKTIATAAMASVVRDKSSKSLKNRKEEIKSARVSSKEGLAHAILNDKELANKLLSGFSKYQIRKMREAARMNRNG